MKFTGILPALVSPMTAEETVAEEATRNLIRFQLNAGADGFYVCGGTGEGLVMKPRERERMCEIVIDEVKGKKPVIIHVASMEMQTAIQLAKHAEKTGANAVASVPPFYFTYDDDDIYAYYKTLAASVKIPVMIYYHPSAQADMSANLIVRIFEIDNVMAVKWSSTNYYEMMKLKEITHGEMNIINGPDECLIAGLAAGADGGIGSSYNLMTPEFRQIYTYMQKGEVDKAQKLQYQVNRVVDILIRHKAIPCTKFALSLLGFDVGNAVFPMKRYSNEEKAVIQNELNAAGFPFAQYMNMNS